MPDWIIKYVGGGFLIIFVYILISNLIWLTIGARALQLLPGVNDKSVKGTFKILILLLMSLFGFSIWLLKLIPGKLKIIKYNTLQEEISASIKNGGIIYQRIRKLNNKK